MLKLVLTVHILWYLALHNLLVSARDDRIVNGHPIDITTVPYLVQIISIADGGHYCGGSLIAPDWVLTAAHCTFRRPIQTMYVRAGSNFRNDGALRKVVQVINHENFDIDQSADYDIALLKLGRPYPKSSTTSPIEIIDSNNEIRVGRSCKISGWGSLVDWDESAVGSKQLQGALVRWMDRNECKAKLPNQITPRMVCAIGGERQDACQGDSGGPLECNHKLAGVVSWGEGCAREGMPGVYVNVALLRPWIRMHTDI